MLLCCFSTEALHGAANGLCPGHNCKAAKIQKRQQVPFLYSCKLMLYTAIHYIHTFINLFVCIRSNIYLVYIILTYIPSNKKSSKAPPKLNQNLLSY